MEEKKLKSLPLGEQTFKDIIEKNKLYVDKTEEIYKLLETRNKYFFLSRPRRFGKSLLISTLKEIFSGNKELFKDLWIYDKIDWVKYPILRIDFNGMVYSQGTKAFIESLDSKIQDLANDYKIVLENKDFKKAFKELIKKLSEKEKVVILIDEYDKPIIEYIEDIEKAKEMRGILKDFYITLKEADEYIHFAFLTGVSKFSKVSVFSALNNLTDISLREKFSKIVGIDEEQLYSYFGERITLLAQKENISEDKLKLILRKWYNGYSWDGKNFVYNPYSLLSVFSAEEFKNYWFETGTPTFLIKMIKEYNLDVKKLEKSVLSEEDFSSYEVDNMNVMALLFQTGYLTIKEIIRNDSFEKEYLLSYPNKEVKDSLLNFILDDFAGKQISNDISINEMVRKLKANDLDSFIDILKSIFGTIAVKMQPDKK
ncbi:MAG: AAA family ATPase, partial [Candidatus Sericytochromatia bacterium]|nr:AAA family ATPase [Candidatus Sericytochromatia bacterium]